MSGPKISPYELRRRERERKRREQIKEINLRLYKIKQKLQDFQEEYGDLARDVIRDLTKQISYISTKGDLRISFKNLRKLENRIKEEEKLLKEEKAFYEKIEFEKRRKNLKIKELLNNLEDIEKEYKEILNENIKNQIKTFKKAIKLNPDNENLINQIENFQNRLSIMYAEYLEKEDNKRYVAKTFSEILGGSVDEGEGGLIISGEIEGVPIKVRVEDNNLRFDTPENGSCIKAMDKIVKELQNKEIYLGPIKVLKTGKVLNQTTQKKRQRIRQ